MPVVDFIPGLRHLAAAAPDTEEEEKEGNWNEISFLAPLCSWQSGRPTADPLFTQTIPMGAEMQNLNQTFRDVYLTASQLWIVVWDQPDSWWWTINWTSNRIKFLWSVLPTGTAIDCRQASLKWISNFCIIKSRWDGSCLYSVRFSRIQSSLSS